MKKVFLLFSCVLDYPTHSFKEDVDHCLQQLEGYDTPSVYYMKKFSKSIQKIPLLQLQELYTQHIDFNPSCSLYVGYHLFGDSYKRSKFLVHLRTLYQNSNFVEKGSELPDSLPVILHYFGEHSYDSEDSHLIIKDSLLPCLRKLLNTFKKAKNIYSDVIHALLNLLVKINQDYSKTLVKEGSIHG